MVHSAQSHHRPLFIEISIADGFDYIVSLILFIFLSAVTCETGSRALMQSSITLDSVQGTNNTLINHFSTVFHFFIKIIKKHFIFIFFPPEGNFSIDAGDGVGGTI